MKSIPHLLLTRLGALKVNTRMRVALLVVAVIVPCVLLAVFRPLGARLPYHDHFADGKMDEWSIYGGSWQIIDGAVSNNSDEMGAKIITGSETLTDYRMDSNVRLTSTFGDTGVIVRVTRQEEGLNAFYGYYVGMRLPDELLLGKMDYGFWPVQRIHIANGVQPNVWYHLSVIARGCTITASAFDSQGNLLATASLADAKGCDAHGAFGLRSFAAGGRWRDVSVRELP